MSGQTDRVKFLEQYLNNLIKIQGKILFFVDDEKKASKEYEEFAKVVGAPVRLYDRNDDKEIRWQNTIAQNPLWEMSKDEGRHYNLLDDLLLKVGNRIKDVQDELARERPGSEAKKYRKDDAFGEYLKKQDTRTPDVRELWRKACEYDHIPPDSKFVSFSKDNPYAKLYNEALNAEAEFGRPSYHHVPEEPEPPRGADAPRGRPDLAEAGPELYTSLTLGYEGMKQRVISLASELHNFVLPSLTKQHPSFDEQTLEKWSSVIVTEKARWIYMDIQNNRFEVNKDNYDVFIRGKNIGNLRTITAEDMFGAM